MRRILRAPAVTGAVIMLGSAWGAFAHLQFEARALRAGGVVVEVVKEQSADLTNFFYPVVEFTDEQGRKVRFRDPLGNAGGPTFAAGSAVEVLYEPDQPSQARIASFSTSWLMPLAGAGFGAMLLAVGWFGGKRED